MHGYFTTDNNLRGLTPAEMERVLGLPPGWLAAGAIVLELVDRPALDQFEVRGSTRRAAGRGLNLTVAELTKSSPGAWHNRRLVKVVPVRGGPEGVVYPDVHGVAAEQWRLLRDLPARELVRLRPGQRYPF